jgi:hypothetical protein
VVALVVSWVAFDPADADVAYAVVNQVGINQSLRGIWSTPAVDIDAPWDRRVTDGQPVGDRTVQLTGGTRVFISPHDPGTVLFAFGATFGGYGTDLFRSDDALVTLAVSHFNDFYEVFALAFGPPSTPVRYVGVSSDIPR